ncbi:MAG: alpha/beta fold hydrolase [Gemmatimonadales bacterium]
MTTAVTADGTRIAYQIQGTGHPLLLVSGQSLDHRMWDSLVPRLAPHFTVITFDHRGTGLSDKPDTPPYTTRLFAEDAVAVLDAAGAHVAHVIGFSMGGRVCQWLAIDHSERVGNMVLAATTAGNARGVERDRRVTALLQGGDMEALDALFYTPAFLAAGGRPWRATSTPLSARRLHYRASETHDAWAQLATITRPTLILHGALDQVTPAENARLMAEAIPGARLVLVPEGRHGLVAELDDATLGTVVEFFLKRSRP